ncbi:MAG TPA: hypothetical protein VKB93_17620 [Thermoanaerobaculia bacterium]|nr:hypothetical protein [Thermoanaerobaculia bacterium]
MLQRATCLLALVLGVTIVAAQAPAPATPPLLDHFEIWKIRSVAAAYPVQLLGQFDEGRWWSAQLRAAEYLGNPTNKTHGDRVAKIGNPDLHLVLYSLTAAVRQPRRNVYFENQFTTALPNGRETWTIGDPALLLVPAGKKIPPVIAQPPAAGDHFVCYVVVPPNPFTPVAVTLEDQFDVRRRQVESITRLKPAFFCVPVQKRRIGFAERPLGNPDTHLAIYEIDPRQPFNLRVSAADQFATRTLQVIESRMLAVPTIKRDWTIARVAAGNDMESRIIADSSGGRADGNAELCGKDGVCNRGACDPHDDPDCPETVTAPRRLTDITDCTSTQATEIGLAIDWGADHWAEYEAALEAIRDWPVDIGNCLENRFKTNGKVVCEASSAGLCKNSGWASPLTRKVHMCPGFLEAVRAMPNLEDRQACYFAMVTHEWGHTCKRGHLTLEIIDDEAFNFWKAHHPGVTKELNDCRMN